MMCVNQDSLTMLVDWCEEAWPQGDWASLLDLGCGDEPDPETFDAQFISQVVPEGMSPSETTTVTITMKNNGLTTWTNGDKIKLFSENASGNTTWGSNRITFLNTESVLYGETWEFSFEITAPSTPGSYNFQWRMLQEGGGFGKFGDFTDNVIIEVDGLYTSINNLNKSESIRIMRNQVLISKSGDVKIYNLTGQVVHQEKVNGSSSISLRSGIYLVRTRVNGKYETKKVLIN